MSGFRLFAGLGSLLRSSSGTVIIRFSGFAALYGIHIAAARFFGAADAGVLALAISIIVVTSVFSRLGVDVAILKYVAGDLATGRVEDVRPNVRFVLGMSLASSALVTFVIFSTKDFLAIQVFSSPRLAPALSVMLLGLIPLSVGIVAAHAIQGIGKIKTAVLLVHGLHWIVMLSIILILGPRIGLVGATWAFVVGSVTVLGASWHCLKGERFVVEPVRTSFFRGGLLRTSMPLYAVAVLSLANVWWPILWIGAVLPPDEVAIFVSAQRTAMIASFVLPAINAVISPKFAAYFARKEGTALTIALLQSAGLAALAAVPIVSVLLIFPDFVLGIFGPEFATGSTALRILAGAQLVNAATGSVGYFLMMTGREVLLRRVMIAAAVVTVSLTLLLTQRFGITGAAIAVAASLIVQHGLSGYLAFSVVRKEIAAGAKHQ